MVNLKFNGVVELYDDDGELQEIANFVRGVRHGRQVFLRTSRRTPTWFPEKLFRYEVIYAGGRARPIRTLLDSDGLILPDSTLFLARDWFGSAVDGVIASGSLRSELPHAYVYCGRTERNGTVLRSAVGDNDRVRDEFSVAIRELRRAFILGVDYIANVLERDATNLALAAKILGVPFIWSPSETKND